LAAQPHNIEKLINSAHIMKHLAGGAGSRFANGVNVAEVIKEALTSPNARFLPNYRPDSFRIVTGLGRAVGDKGQTSIRVVVKWTGEIITAFPVKGQ
jgi:hypothetical protein